MPTKKNYPLRHPLRKNKYGINGVSYQKYKSRIGKGDLGLVQASIRTLNNVRISTTFTLNEHGFEEAIRLANIFVLKERMKIYKEAIKVCREEIARQHKKGK